MEPAKSMKRITVRVGSRPEDGCNDETKYKEYSVPGKILAGKSPFFQTRLKPEWMAKCGPIISIPDHLPGTFNVYLRWITSREILVGSDESGPDGLEVLVRASIVGDEFQDIDFRDAISDAIINWLLMHENFDMFKYIQHVYKNTIEYDPLREIALDSCVYQNGLGWLYHGRQQGRIPMEIMWDLVDACNLRAYASYVTFRNRVKREPCRYHKHNDEQCYRLKRRYRDGVIVLPEVEDE